MAAGLEQHGGVDAVESGVAKRCGEVIVGGFAVARARLPDERGCAVLLGEEGLLQAGVWVVFDVVGGGGSAVLAKKLFGALGYW